MAHSCRLDKRSCRGKEIYGREAYRFKFYASLALRYIHTQQTCNCIQRQLEKYHSISAVRSLIRWWMLLVQSQHDQEHFDALLWEVLKTVNISLLLCVDVP